MEKTELIKCLIIGSGPAGYTSAIYTARAGLKPVLYTGLQMGGQLTTTTEVENFPGFPEGIDGNTLMENMMNQAKRFDVDIRFGIINEVNLKTYPFEVVTDDGKQIKAESLIIATGATARRLGIESEKKYNGHGVSACATCDGFFYRGADIAVVGGGDTACEEATYLAKLGRKVYMIVRRDEFRASKPMQERVFKTPNIEVLWNSVTDEILGDGNVVTGVRIKNVKTNETREIDIQGFFVAIGHVPNTDIFKGQLDLDEAGYLITKPDSTRTNIEGVYAAGDVQDRVFRQAITAAATGCMAALEAERWLAEKE
ncbi:MAG: thioredoxin-disulfide reductase [Lentimicrobiaceae bacterium]|nr:thioredoxin-disulfide reductase [Lentimicrobiaceae bacterium]